MNWKIPLFKSYWEEDDVDAVAKVIRRGTYWSSGPEIETLEQHLAEYVGEQYALTFNSGTSALHVLLLAHGITSGEVIVPSFTFIATANTVALAGAKPVFAEIEDQSYGLDPEDVKEKITKKTRAIIPVHYGGFPCKSIQALREIADDHDLLLIEDAAESLGATQDKKMVGTFGQSSIFSFCQNKIITAGEGGAVVTNSKDIYQRLKLLRSHGRQENEEGYFSTTKELDYIDLGYNFRLPTINAALVDSQLKKIKRIIEMRREKAATFTKQLSSKRQIKTPKEEKNQFSVYQMYTIQFEDQKTRDAAQNMLTKAGVMTKVYFEPIHLKTFYRQRFNYKPGDLPNTEQISKKILTLPLYPTLTDAEIEYITNTIKCSCR
jgi:dTDP-4-amino-4,6-dideoxygalactose transaminase